MVSQTKGGRAGRVRSVVLSATILATTLALAACASVPPSDAEGGPALPPAQTTTIPASQTLDAPDPPTADPYTVVTVGDSIMTGNGVDPDQAWPVLLADSEGWQLTNLAEDGAGFLAIGDDGGTLADQVTKAESLPSAPDLILVSASSNDLGEDPSDIGDAARSAFARLKATFPSSTIIGLSAIWGSDDPDEGLAPLNDAVQQAALDEGADWIDVGEPLLDQPDLMQDDDVHPTADGLVVMANALGEDLQPFVPAD